MAAEDTSPAPLDPARQRKIRWDPTINLGHVLTFLGFLCTGAVAYFDLRERIAVQEVRVAGMETESKEAVKRTQDKLIELRDDVREVRRGVDELNRRRGSP